MSAPTETQMAGPFAIDRNIAREVAEYASETMLDPTYGTLTRMFGVIATEFSVYANNAGSEGEYIKLPLTHAQRAKEYLVESAESEIADSKAGMHGLRKALGLLDAAYTIEQAQAKAE